MSRLLAYLALGLLTACGGPTAPTKQRPLQGLEHNDSDSTANLIRDLEAAVLMSYSQLTLANYDAYMDGVAQDADVAFIGVSGGDLVVGTNSKGDWVTKKPYYKRLGVQVFSKNLRVSLSRDRQLGWISDEISYRVPFRIRLSDDAVIERTASIPMRVTAAFVRNVNRWVMVTEHVSYGLPVGDIVDLARGKRIGKPLALPEEGAIAERTADDIAAVVEAFHRQGDERRSAISTDDRVVLIFPASVAEYRGREIAEAPSLAELFGGGTVDVLSTRVSARIGKTAWMVANLRVNVGTGEDRTAIPARASYILEVERERGEWRWRIVQAHISVPLEKEQLDQRVFGVDEAPETAARD